jgi:hypothetical protein
MKHTHTHEKKSIIIILIYIYIYICYVFNFPKKSSVNNVNISENKKLIFFSL